MCKVLLTLVLLLFRDMVWIYAASEYNNYDNPVILYKLFKYVGLMFSTIRIEIFFKVGTVVPKNFNFIGILQKTISL